MCLSVARVGVIVKQKSKREGIHHICDAQHKKPAMQCLVYDKGSTRETKGLRSRTDLVKQNA